MITLDARVLPWNVPNSYGEIIAKGALDKFFGSNEAVPMKVMHSGSVIGIWTHFEQRDDALWAKGMIAIPKTAETLALLGEVPELSISFRDLDNMKRVTARRFRDFKACGVFMPRDMLVVDETITENAMLSEISLVTKGSFTGTSYTVE